MKINKKVKDEIVRILVEKGVNKPCSRCNHTSFSILDGFINLPLSDEVISGSIIIGGTNVPCAIVACNNCGHLSYHAIGALGMLDESKEDKS